ncbi:endonuclease domain-containing protein [Psychromonas aquimarina]|uniref:endonuclease domain-containing protein n=1 Tax=Psychromonas aquimarina TaxID=444919 RepID=UPI0004919717|nr:endonuclease domain-containing protein [Psychromonas aquimarina]
MKPKQLKEKELNALRVELLTKQKNKCPICKRKHKTSDRTWHVDHAHQGEPHEHRVRAILCPACNTTSGAVWKKLIRAGLVKELGADGCIAWLSSLSAHFSRDYSDMPWHPNRIQDESKRFNKSTKAEQLKMLADPPAKATKAELVKQYKKQLRKT